MWLKLQTLVLLKIKINKLQIKILLSHSLWGLGLRMTITGTVSSPLNTQSFFIVVSASFISSEFDLFEKRVCIREHKDNCKVAKYYKICKIYKKRKLM